MAKGELFTLNGVTFRYGDKALFDSLACCLQEGRFYGLIGPNGSGKSTLLELLIGSRKPQAGSLLFKARELQRYSRRDLAKLIALVPQRIMLGFDFSVEELVLMGRHPHMPRFARPSPADLAKVEEALGLLDIGHLRARTVTALSGGEQQRVVVARALAQDTPVIVLDEATSNLDIAHTIEIMQVFRKKVDQSAATVIAAIHDLNMAAAFCDELLVLKEGRLHAQGPVPQVLTSALLAEVFAVEGNVVNTGTYPRIDFHLLPRQSPDKMSSKR